jgi:RsiW-degrading membrane proteinase PrsW (M82 family)
MILFLSAVAPALFIMYLIYRHDLEKEPIKMLVKAFFGGVLSILLTLIIVYPISPIGSFFTGGFLQSFFSAFFEAGIPEELSKWIIFYWLIKRAPHFDQYYDGILYAIFISMGFALVENLMYVYGTSVKEGYSAGLSVAALRAIMSVPGHMLFAVPMGYFLSLSKFEQGKEASKHIMLSLAVPILLHGLFDFILMYSSSIGETNPLFALLLLLIFIFFDIYIWRLGLRKIKEHLNKDKVIN